MKKSESDDAVDRMPSHTYSTRSMLDKRSLLVQTPTIQDGQEKEVEIPSTVLRGYVHMDGCLQARG